MRAALGLSRTRAAEARKQHSVGLGLSIVRQIARVQGGYVTCENREGGGGRFMVTVPIEDL